MAKSKPEFLLVDGCPVPYDIAAQVRLITRRAKQSVSSAYRGERAKALLHAHGKHTQAEIHAEMPAISNPPGHSQHELFDDEGHSIPAWKCGIDSGTNSSHDKRAINAAAAHYGWRVHHPYSRGVEGHHWQLTAFPKTRKRDRLVVAALRRTLPRH